MINQYYIDNITTNDRIVLANKHYLYNRDTFIHGRDRTHIYIIYGIFMFITFLYMCYIIKIITLNKNENKTELILYTTILMLNIVVIILITLMIFLSGNHAYINPNNINTLKQSSSSYILIMLYLFTIFVYVDGFLLVLFIVNFIWFFASFLPYYIKYHNNKKIYYKENIGYKIDEYENVYKFNNNIEIIIN